MDRKLHVVLVAGESAGVRVLRGLLGTPHRVIAVLAGGGREDQGLTRGVWQEAQEHGIHVEHARRVKDPSFAAFLRDQSVDVLLSVRSLYIIAGDVLAAPRIGAFNLHTGPLPRYAGRNVISMALYNGEATHGVAVHRMVEDVDVGDIAYEATFPITLADTGLTVTSKCIREGVPLIMKLLEAAAENPDGIPRRPQDPSAWRYFDGKVPQGGWIDWTKPARNVVDFVRACDFFPHPSPWGTPQSRLQGRTIGIAKASLTDRSSDVAPGTISVEDDIVHVACGDACVALHTVVERGERKDPRDVLGGGDLFEQITSADAQRGDM